MREVSTMLHELRMPAPMVDATVQWQHKLGEMALDGLEDATFETLAPKVLGACRSCLGRHRRFAFDRGSMHFPSIPIVVVECTMQA